MFKRKKLLTTTFALLGLLLVFSSCKKEYESIESIDEAKIQAYIKQANLSVTKDPSGYYYQVVTPGTGNLFLNKDSVLYNVKISSTTGVQYLASPVVANLGTYVGYTNVILGRDIPAIREVMLKLKPGGVAKIILPSYLAFGKNGDGDIPSNEVVVFEITTYAQTKQWELDDARIKNFLTTKGITAISDPSRNYYQTVTPGTGGDVIGPNSTVVYKYTGRLLDGTVFDSSTDGTFSTTFASIALKGWKTIASKFTAGAKFRMFLPSDQAYGTAVSGKIPSNSVLDFDIEIVSVTNN